MRLEIGNRVRCNDGPYGELADVVIDPLVKRVTHLVVRPEHADDSRLVPIDLATNSDDNQREVELGCTLDEAQKFESVHEAAYIRLGETRLRTRTGTSASWTYWRVRTTPLSA